MYVRKNSKSSHLYVTADEVIFKLSEIYKNVDWENTYCEQYRMLTQGTQHFIKFYFKFKHLSSHLSYNNKQLLTDLKNKLFNYLHTAWALWLDQVTSLKNVKDYLIYINNEY